jgi:molecular chaperone GrpE
MKGQEEAMTDDVTPDKNEATAETEATNPELQPPPATGAEDIPLQERIEEAVSAALAQQRDLVLRTQAELQTMRRRCEADMEKAHKFALEKFSGELISVVDNLERALTAADGHAANPVVQALHEGVALTLKGCLEVFAKFNIQQIDPRGAPFDPQEQQAVATVPNAAVAPNTVIEVMQKGYSLNGRVLRPAMVVVSKAP